MLGRRSELPRSEEHTPDLHSSLHDALPIWAFCIPESGTVATMESRTVFERHRSCARQACWVAAPNCRDRKSTRLTSTLPYTTLFRSGLSASQKAELWQRWKAGQSLSDIGRALGKHAGSPLRIAEIGRAHA